MKKAILTGKYFQEGTSVGNLFLEKCKFLKYQDKSVQCPKIYFNSMKVCQMNVFYFVISVNELLI